MYVHIFCKRVCVVLAERANTCTNKSTIVVDIHCHSVPHNLLLYWERPLCLYSLPLQDIPSDCSTRPGLHSQRNVIPSCTQRSSHGRPQVAPTGLLRLVATGKI